MEYLFSVYWKQYNIGYCFKRNSKFVFIYNQEGIEESNELGFDYLIGFPDINKIYVSDHLFPIFESRIMSNKRSNLIGSTQKIEYLINTNGSLTTDNITIKKDETYGKSRI